MPPTNRAVSVWGMVIDQFEGSKVKSTRILMDTMGLMQQLGRCPALLNEPALELAVDLGVSEETAYGRRINAS